MRGFFYFILSQIKKLKTSITTDETNIETLQGKMTTAESNIETLQGKMTTTESNIETLQGKMTTAENNISKLQEKNYIITGLSANTNYTTSHSYGSELIPLNSEISKNGNLFELITTGDDTGKIKVNKDCYIKMNASVMLSHTNNKESIIGIFKNNVKLISLYDSTPSGSWITTTFSNYIIQASKDDLIYLTYGANDSGVNVRIASKDCAYFTIEEYK